MTREVLCYISGPNEMTDRKAVLEYVLANGLGEVRRGVFGQGLKSEDCLAEVVPGPLLAEAIKAAQDGGFVTNGLSSFGVRPSEQRANILALMAKNVDVHIVGLGRVDTVLHILKATWEAGAELERQMSELERDYADQEQRLRDRMASFEDKVVARMAEVVGQSSVKQFYTNGSHAPEPEPVTDPTALRVKELREARKWSMEQLAEAAGTSKGMIQRIEQRGKGEALGRVLSVLEHGAAQ